MLITSASSMGARRFTTHGEACWHSASPYRPRLRAGSPAKWKPSHQRQSCSRLGACQEKPSPLCLNLSELDSCLASLPSLKHLAAPLRSTWPTRQLFRLKLLCAKLKRPEATPGDCGETMPSRARVSVPPSPVL